jgi:hypothetical protein
MLPASVAFFVAWAAASEPLPEGRADRDELVALHDGLVGSSAAPPPWPVGEDAARLRAALVHPDPRVRRIASEAVRPFVAPTPYDPPSPDGAPFLDAAAVAALAADRDPGVRRRAVHLLRAAHPALPTEPLARAYRPLLSDRHGGVRATALRAAADAVGRGLLSAADAWALALAAVPAPRPAGRAACGALARLRRALGPGDVDPIPAFEACLSHHPEHAWPVAAAWGDDLPVRADWIEALLLGTDTVDPAVVRGWVARDPAAVDRALQGWPTDHAPTRRAFVDRLRAPR